MPLRIKLCPELSQLEVDPADKDYCEECKKTGDQWVHLRKCQHCGVTLCCDSSNNQHARKHFETTGHPVIISVEKDEHWSYCYTHQQINMKAF